MFNKDTMKKELVELLKAHVQENLKTKTQAEYVRTQWPANWAESDAEMIISAAEAKAMKYFEEQVYDLFDEAITSINADLNAAYFIKCLD